GVGAVEGGGARGPGPAAGRQYSRHDPQQRALAAPRGSDEREELAFVHLQIDGPQDPDAALVEVLDLLESHEDGARGVSARDSRGHLGGSSNGILAQVSIL